MTTTIRSHRRREAPRGRLVGALATAAVLLLGTLALSTGTPVAAAESANPQLDAARLALANCQLLAANSSGTQRTRAQQCVTDQQRIIALLTRPTTPPSSTAPPTTVPPTTPPVTTAPPATTVPPTTPPTTAPPTEPPPGDTLFCAPFPAFPDEHCTGYKHTGVTLHACGGDDGGAIHLEQAGATYDGCLFRNSLVIQAPNITIRRSWVQGTVYPHGEMRTPTGDKPDCKGLKLIDVEVGPSSDPDRAGVGNCFNKSLLRVDVHGTASGIHVSDFNSVVDSWSHDFVDSGSHGAAAGTGQDMGNHSVIAHNNLNCSRTNGAAHCSSALSLYDEPTLDDVLVQQNLFNSVSGFCAYGGNTGTNIRFIDNVFGQRYFDSCGPVGPITVFRFNEGNVWTNNRYADGRPVTP